jgi:hypothetical protein
MRRRESVKNPRAFHNYKNQYVCVWGVGVNPDIPQQLIWTVFKTFDIPCGIEYIYWFETLLISLKKPV